MTKSYASINPKNYTQTTESYDPTAFAALVKVTGSMYVKGDTNFGDSAVKVKVQWTLESTKGNTFTKSWSTGLQWNDDNAPSADGRRLPVPMRPSSDAIYMIQKAIAAGFPEDQVTDDISVFEGHCFFIADDKNPKWASSGKKSYPKRYHPEGWEAAKATALAKKAAKAAGSTYQENASNSSSATPTGSYAPPPIVVASSTKDEASKALVAILGVSGGKPMNRTGILQGLANYWTTELPSIRQNVTLALWDFAQAAEIVQSNPALKITGNSTDFTVSFK